MAARQLESIECSLQPMDIAFHPTKQILSAGLVDGTVEFHDYSIRMPSDSAQIPDEEEDTILSSIPVHDSEIPKFKATTPISHRGGPSCRAVIFDPTGDHLYTASNAGSLAAIDVNRASYHRTSDDSILWKIDNASPYGIHSIHHMQPHAGECIVTGDDEGVIRIFDVRTCGMNSSSNKPVQTFENCMSLPKGCLASFHENTDIISSFQTDAACNTLLATSSDGVLTIIDLRKGCAEKKKEATKPGIEPVKINPDTKQGPFRLSRKSDDQEDELLSMTLMKHGKKVVVGTQQGVLNFWSFGTWGDISDRFPGHPQSIDALLKVDEDTLLTGSSDGVVRILQVQPDQLLGVLGDHGGFPVEKLKFGADKKVIGSLSHDAFVRLWDASIFFDDDDDDEDEEMEGMDSQAVANKVASSATKKADNSDDDWEDDDSDDSMDSDSDSDDDEGGKGNKGGRRKFKTENEEFFSDL